MSKRILGKFEYNSPVILTFAILAILIHFVDLLLPIRLTADFFTYYGSISVIGFVRLLLWPLGHFNLEHLTGNLTFILLIGPMIEKKYSSKTLLILMIVSAVVIGGVQGLIFRTGILGASGIVFMLIVLTSFTNDTKDKIPLTFVAIAIIFLGREIYTGVFVQNNISELSHLMGAFIGIIYDRVFHKPVRSSSAWKI